jgi:hypothetical protein
MYVAYLKLVGVAGKDQHNPYDKRKEGISEEESQKICQNDFERSPRTDRTAKERD